MCSPHLSSTHPIAPSDAGKASMTAPERGDRVVYLKASDCVLIALLIAAVYLLARRAFHKAPAVGAAEQARKGS